MAWQSAKKDYPGMAKLKRHPSVTEVQARIGNRIEWARELVYPNASEFARLLEIDPSTLAKHESGDRAPSVFTVIAIANRLRVSTDYLLTGRMDARMDQEMALQLAARHPELVLGQTDTAQDTDRVQVGDSDRRPKKSALAG